KELREKQTEMVKMVTAGDKAINKLQDNRASIEAMVERAKKEVTEILEGEESKALKQADGIQVHLEQRCTELKKTQAQMEKLSKIKNDIDFLQV
ncbi:hypothetical protein XENOCAPTIV_008248, partial [Xenoophorus captivus]